MAKTKEKSTTLMAAGALALLGFGLLALNVVGLFMSMRNPAIYSEPDTLFQDDATLTYEQALEGIKRLDGESELDYVTRVNGVVNQAVAHYWRMEGAQKYNLRVPAWENYLLYVNAHTWPRRYAAYQFIDHERALERGVGLCAQHAFILHSILEQEGIDGGVVVLGGHVVLAVELEGGQNVVADPDLGVVVPHAFEAVMNRPEIARPYYQRMTSKFNPRRKADAFSLDQIVEMYGPRGNVLLPGPINFTGSAIYYFEPVSYVVIWIIPILLIMPAAVLAARARGAKGSRREDQTQPMEE